MKKLTPKEKDIKKYLELMNILDMFKGVLRIVISNMIPVTKVVDELIDMILTEEDIALLEQSFILIYSKHFTHRDIKTLIEFYSSTVGKKSIDKTSIMMSESSVAGASWADKIIARHQKEIEEILNLKANNSNDLNDLNDLLA